MFCHFFELIRPGNAVQSAIYHLAGYGTHGVDLFFLLSGYLITGILLRSKHDDRYFQTFFVRRALRIFPLYYASLIVLLVLLPLISGYARSELAQTLPHQAWAWFYAVNFFRFFNPRHDLPYLGHYWTLSIEEHFYLLWPFAVRWVSPVRLSRVLIGIVIINWAAAAFFSLVPIDPERFALWTTPLRIDMLAAGALLAIWKHDRRRNTFFVRIAKTTFVVGLVISVAAIFVGRYGGAVGVVPGIRLVARRILVLSLFSWVVAAPEKSTTYHLAASRVMGFLGKYSYGLYVFHSMLAVAAYRAGFVDKIAHATGSVVVGAMINAIVCGAISVVLAMTSYRFLESPFLALKHRFAPGSRAHRESSSPLLAEVQLPKQKGR